MAKCNIMMIGTSVGMKGGISSVVQGYYDSELMDELGIDYYPTHTNGTKLDKIFFYINGIMSISINIFRYKIVHLHAASRWSFRRLYPIICLAKIIFRKKVVIHVHGAEFDIYYNKTNFLEKCVIRHGFNLADAVIALSKEWKEKLSKICIDEKIDILPNCISINSHKKIISDQIYFLFLGEIGQRKGVYDLVDAFAEIVKKDNTVQLILCGDGEIEKLKHKVCEMGLVDRVSVPGWVAGQQKQKLLEGAYAYILPSYNEGLPVSILEAIATGTPVISTRVGGIPDVVTDGVNGYLIEPGNVTQLIEAIRKILSNEKLWKNMSDAAYEKARESFSMEQNKYRISELYHRLMRY